MCVPRLAEVVAPTLVIHRRSCVEIDIGHAHFLAERLPHAELAIVPGTDSLWFTDMPDLLDRAIAVHPLRRPAASSPELIRCARVTG